MLDTYNDWNPNNPINQIEVEAKVLTQPTTLFSAVNEQDEDIANLYFNHIEKRLQTLIDYAQNKGDEAIWLAKQIKEIKDLIK